MKRKGGFKKGTPLQDTNMHLARSGSRLILEQPTVTRHPLGPLVMTLMGAPGKMPMELRRHWWHFSAFIRLTTPALPIFKS
jgi:hypothetical protein